MAPSDDETPPFLLPLVLPVEAVEPVREGALDWYLPPGPPGLPGDSGPGLVPAVVFVHGGPVPDWLEPKPRAWPSYRAYGAWAARSGFVGVTFDHGFDGYEAFDVALDDIGAAVEATRAHPRVDPEQIVIWGFSGAGMLLGRWLANPPGWLRGVAVSYPCCRPLETVTSAPLSMAEAVDDAGVLPILLTRVGLERDEVAATVDEFVAAATAAGARLAIIDVPNGQHGFDQIDPGEESQDAVRGAMAWVAARLED